MPVSKEVRSWYEWLPGWVPICVSIFGASLWVGQYTQSINDRLKNVEIQVNAIEEYLKMHPAQGHTIGDVPFQGVPLTQLQEEVKNYPHL